MRKEPGGQAPEQWRGERGQREGVWRMSTVQVCCMFAFKVETRQRAQDSQGPGLQRSWPWT